MKPSYREPAPTLTYNSYYSCVDVKHKHTKTAFCITAWTNCSLLLHRCLQLAGSIQSIISLSVSGLDKGKCARK